RGLRLYCRVSRVTLWQACPPGLFRQGRQRDIDGRSGAREAGSLSPGRGWPEPAPARGPLSRVHGDQLPGNGPWLPALRRRHLRARSGGTQRRRHPEELRDLASRCNGGLSAAGDHRRSRDRARRGRGSPPARDRRGPARARRHRAGGRGGNRARWRQATRLPLYRGGSRPVSTIPLGTLRPVHVVGVGMHPYQFPSETPYVRLGLAAIRMALADAGVRWPEVEAAFVGTTGTGMASGRTMFRHLGSTGLAVMQVENASASGSTAFRSAVTAVACGAADVALAVGVDKFGDAQRSGRKDGIERLSDSVHVPLVKFALL